MPGCRGLCRRMPAGFAGRGLLQAGRRLGVPGWRPAPRLPQRQINASLPLPPCFPPAPRTTSVATGEGARGRTRRCGDRDAGAHHLLPAPAGGEEDGASNLIPLIPFPCLPVGGPGPGKRGNAFLKTTAICKANQMESLKFLEILFFFLKKKRKGKVSCAAVQVGSSRRAASGSVNHGSRRWTDLPRPHGGHHRSTSYPLPPTPAAAGPPPPQKLPHVSPCPSEGTGTAVSRASCHRQPWQVLKSKPCQCSPGPPLLPFRPQAPFSFGYKPMLKSS